MSPTGVDMLNGKSGKMVEQEHKEMKANIEPLRLAADKDKAGVRTTMGRIWLEKDKDPSTQCW